MLKKLLLLYVFSIMAPGAACSSAKVRHDFDKEADFARLQTYYWIAKVVYEFILTERIEYESKTRVISEKRFQI